jgi:hypothetical protein
MRSTNAASLPRFFVFLVVSLRRYSIIVGLIIMVAWMLRGEGGGIRLGATPRYTLSGTPVPFHLGTNGLQLRDGETVAVRVADLFQVVKDHLRDHLRTSPTCDEWGKNFTRSLATPSV